MSELMQKQVNTFLMPKDSTEAFTIAEGLAKSGMIPKQFIGKPMDIVVCMAMGAEIGFQPLQSLQNIAVINGRPSVWGDAFRALIISAPDLVGFKEWFDANTNTAHCKIERRLASGAIMESEQSFGMQDAKTAGLWGKQGPWTQYPKRMMQWRALGFAGRDIYADRLRGIWIDHEAQDMAEEKDVTPQPAQNQEQESTLDQVLGGEFMEEKAPDDLFFNQASKAISDCNNLGELAEVGDLINGSNAEITESQRLALKDEYLIKKKQIIETPPATQAANNDPVDFE